MVGTVGCALSYQLKVRFFTRCGSALSRRGCSCLPAVSPLLSPAVGPLFCFLSPGSSFAESADFAQVLVGAAAVLFDVLVCVSVCLSVRLSVCLSVCLSLLV